MSIAFIVSMAALAVMLSFVFLVAWDHFAEMQWTETPWWQFAVVWSVVFTLLIFWM